MHNIYCMIEARDNTAEVIRSARKTVSVEIRPDGSVLVRAPYRMSQARIRAFLDARRDWIEKHRAAMAERQRSLQQVEPLTAAELDTMAKQAKTVLKSRVEHFAPIVGVSYGRITIRRQRTRWGSCSSRGNLNFNCLLMLTPTRVQDYVVVHELCHRKHMNHSPQFWAEVERVMPDWRDSRRWLRDNGGVLMARLDSGSFSP